MMRNNSSNIQIDKNFDVKMNQTWIDLNRVNKKKVGGIHTQVNTMGLYRRAWDPEFRIIS